MSKTETTLKKANGSLRGASNLLVKDGKKCAVITIKRRQESGRV